MSILDDYLTSLATWSWWTRMLVGLVEKIVKDWKNSRRSYKSVAGEKAGPIELLMPRLADFSGGLNRRYAPTRVPPNQGVVFNNVDNTGGILKSAKGNKLLPELNSSGVNSVDVGNQRFDFRTQPPSTAVYYNPQLVFGATKQYRVRALELRQSGELYVIGNVRIPSAENYQIVLTTIEDNPTSITLLTSNSVFSDPRDTLENNILFTLTEAQRTPFLNKAFGIRVLRVVGTDNNPIGLDSNEVLSRLNGHQFFREAGSSLIEYNDTAYFTRENGKPLKIYGTTRNFNDVSTTINQPYASEHLCVSGGYTNNFIRINNTTQPPVNSDRFSLASVNSVPAYTDRVCGNKLLRWSGKTLYTSEITLSRRSGLFDDKSTAIGGDSIAYLSSILDAEAIPGYTFKLLWDSTVVIGDRIEFNLQEIIPTSNTLFQNSANYPRITVLDYPTNYVPDINQTAEQQLNTFRETITQTRLLVYTTNGKGHIISFTRDAKADGAKLLNYQPGIDNSNDFPLNTTTVSEREKYLEHCQELTYICIVVLIVMGT